MLSKYLYMLSTYRGFASSCFLPSEDLAGIIFETSETLQISIFIDSRHLKTKFFKHSIRGSTCRLVYKRFDKHTTAHKKLCGGSLRLGQKHRTLCGESKHIKTTKTP